MGEGLTTIAYKDGVIAYDSQVTAGETISNLKHNKCCTVGRGDNKVKFIFAGSLADRDELISAYYGHPVDDSLACGAVVINNEGVFAIGVEDGKLWKNQIDNKDIFAVGSGEGFAYGAMDMGADAKQAVKVASGRDLYTGGRIRTIKIHSQK